MKKFLLFILFFLSIILVFFSSSVSNGFSTGLFSCRFSQTSGPSSSAIFYANKNFYQNTVYASSSINDSSNLLNTKTQLGYDSNYDFGFSCQLNLVDVSSQSTKLVFQTVSASSACPIGTTALFYYTGTTNSKIAINVIPSDLSYYTNKTCIGVPNQFSGIHIKVSKKSLSLAGYSCLFRLNSLNNSVLSSCNSIFDFGNNKYKYVVWAKIYQNSNSLVCNNDCTSKLDNRVYTSCSNKLSQCSYVPKVCNGALLNSWVKYNSTAQIQCSAPWNVMRTTLFTNSTLEIHSLNNTCSNFIVNKYPVMINNQLVTMNIYICQN